MPTWRMRPLSAAPATYQPLLCARRSTFVCTRSGPRLQCLRLLFPSAAAAKQLFARARLRQALTRRGGRLSRFCARALGHFGGFEEFLWYVASLAQIRIGEVDPGDEHSCEVCLTRKR